MSLSTEEYENIWLRIKERISKWVVGYLLIIIFLPVTILTTFGLEKIVDLKVEDKIETMISSKEFSNKIATRLTEKIEQVNKKILTANSQLQDLENKAKEIDNFARGLPMKVSGNRLSIGTSLGNVFTIEKGYCVPLGNIKFSSPFSKPPSVYITDCPSFNKKPSSIVISNISTVGFTLYSRNSSDLTNKVSWIAINK